VRFEGESLEREHGCGLVGAFPFCVYIGSINGVASRFGMVFRHVVEWRGLRSYSSIVPPPRVVVVMRFSCSIVMSPFQGARRARVHGQHMSELHQDMRIREQQEETRKRLILQEQEAKLASEMQRYARGRGN
jgi:hypothetical protein